MLRHKRLSPPGSTTRKKMISPPNRISRRLGMMLARSAAEKISPPNDSRNQRVTIGSKGTKARQSNKGGPKNRAEYRPEPADDDHRQIVYRDGQLKLFVIGDPQIIGI